MIEFYEAYADFRDCMDRTEALLRGIARDLLGRTRSVPGRRIRFRQAVRAHDGRRIDSHFNPDIAPPTSMTSTGRRNMRGAWASRSSRAMARAKVQIEIFDETVEHRLQGSDFHHRVSDRGLALARCNDEDPFVTDRFELHRRARDRQRVFRAERSGGSGRTLPPSG